MKNLRQPVSVKHVTPRKAGSSDVKVGKVTLHLTNQSKIYWPAEGITKGDLVKYYKDIAPVMLPYIRNRPQSMNRFPNGIYGPSFYHKDVDLKTMPPWLKTKPIYSESNKDDVNYLVCNDEATLMYMANLGCIEINPWNSRVGKLKYPDWMVLDLDPGKIDFEEVVRVAKTAKEIFDQLEIDAYIKTSGATGLHIYVPLDAMYDYDTVRTFGHLIASLIHEKLPATTSMVRSPAKRVRKIYLDYLQNSMGQTIAAPYSVRPRPGATVSTPLNWSELTKKLNPVNFTMKNIFKRLDKIGDLWEPVIGKGQNILHALKKLRVDN